MKEIIISADGNSVVYSVPDDVANHLRKYCIEFCDKWMKKALTLSAIGLKTVTATMKQILSTI